MESFDETYRNMSDEELLDLAGQATDLLPAAERSLRVELTRRGLEAEAERRERQAQALAPAHEATEPDLSKLVPVYSAQNEIEGRLAQDLLRASGIASVLRRQVVSIVFPGACEILVLGSEEDAARRIIEEYQKSESLPEDGTEASDEGTPDES